MKSRICKLFRPLFALAMAGVFALAPSAVTRADEGEENVVRSSKGLEGTWRVQVTIRDCTTGAPQPSFAAMLTFAQGGTLTETTANPAFLQGQRSPGHGAWFRAGRHTYRASDEAFILYESAPHGPFPGFPRGVQRLTQVIQIGANPDAFTSVASIEFFDTAGNSLATGCATAVGWRY